MNNDNVSASDDAIPSGLGSGSGSGLGSPSPTRPGPDVAGNECDVEYANVGEWTLDEETTLVKHMQNIFEPDFDASNIRPLLPDKSERSIIMKWKMLSSSLLTDLLKRKQNNPEDAPDTDTKNNTEQVISPRWKKKHKRDGTVQWTEADLERLMKVMEEYNCTTPKWNDIAPKFPGKTPVDCLAQWQNMSVPHQIKGKGSWTPAEDTILRSNYRLFGNKWSKIAQYLPGRTGKQCRERFVNHLDPSLKKCEWSDDEEAILIGMHKHHGNKWTLIAKNIPGRSDNDVKNHWYSTISRKFQIHGKDKLTVAAIQQVFMLVTAGIVSQDLIQDWPGAPSAQIPPPHAYHNWYGHSIPPPNYQPLYPLPPSIQQSPQLFPESKCVEDAVATQQDHTLRSL